MTNSVRGKAVSIVGAGPSIQNYKQTTEIIWPVGMMIFAMANKGHEIHRGIWLDDLWSNTQNWSWQAFCWLTVNWPFGERVKLLTGNGPWSHEDNWKSKGYKHIEQFNIEHVVDLFNTDYVNNSTAAAIVQAIIDEASEIHLHGVDFTPDPPGHEGAVGYTDRSAHRGCVEYWIAKAEMAGIKIVINAASNIMDMRYRHMRGFTCRGIVNERVMELPTTNQTIMKEWLAGKRYAHLFPEKNQTK